MQIARGVIPLVITQPWRLLPVFKEDNEMIEIYSVDLLAVLFEDYIYL
jgi:hypothetical protein